MSIEFLAFDLFFENWFHFFDLGPTNQYSFFHLCRALSGRDVGYGKVSLDKQLELFGFILVLKQINSKVLFPLKGNTNELILSEIQIEDSEAGGVKALEQDKQGFNICFWNLLSLYPWKMYLISLSFFASSVEWRNNT